MLRQEGLDWPFCVLPKPDETLTNKLVMMVEDENGSVDRDKILSFLKSGLPKYHDPKEVIAVPDLLKTPTGKIDRRANIKAYL
jgi:acyl-CoA synthetase (AMP-forming)/AMP-acid ligase II